MLQGGMCRSAMVHTLAVERLHGLSVFILHCDFLLHAATPGCNKSYTRCGEHAANHKLRPGPEGKTTQECMADQRQ